MKMEHKAIIDRAKLSGVAPSDLAHELTVHDLVEAALFEIKNIHAPWSKLNEGSQQEVITRLSEAATESVHRAIAIISSRSVDTIPLTVHNADFKQKAIKITASVDAHDPNRAGLIDVAGKLCLLVLAPTDYIEGLDFIRPDRDQPDLPLHVSDLTGSLFEHRATGPDEPDGEDVFVGHDQDPLYAEAVQHVTETRRATVSSVQRHLKVGYNRAARMIEWMESQGIVTQMNSNGSREVLAQAPQSAPNDDDAVDAGQPGDFDEVHDVGQNPAVFEKEFGEFTYDDAAQLIVLKSGTKAFKAHWIQSRLAIDSDKAASLLIRLLDNGVIKLESEGENALDHSYKVIATLEDVT
ncbi:DNA translocase FtsK [Pseudomonas extremaustralis]|uniref:DNA translocase FtsK n=1 Tax=Pseudomonas extremaustralis TaxID=359110 RepID=A0A5M9IWL8_9PSED|nr:DNA translocase FtsK [Pseudomonas extremaustralis]KAA8560553.1 DNA translocase FtsK [Pseudomonas extremaustralis]